MRCPTLAELPPPPEGKTGWPWTVECPQLPDVMRNGKRWPRISIVTPNYNQGQFIEETVRSVLLQGYPELEYIIMDGASTDGSVAIIRKYEAWLKHWESVPDRGQAHAINKGLQRASGEIFHWINSDDLLLPSALDLIAVGFGPERACLFNVVCFTEEAETIFRHRHFHPNEIGDPSRVVPFAQPGLILPKRIYEAAGGLAEDLSFSFDSVILFYAANLVSEWALHDQPIVKFRLHPQSKTSNPERFAFEQSLLYGKLYSMAANDTQRANFQLQQKLAEAHGKSRTERTVAYLRLYLQGCLRYRSFTYHKNMLGRLI